MSSKAPKKKTYLLFRRYTTGITVACVIVTIIASFNARVSFEWITFRALAVSFGIYLLQRILLATWSAWEVTRGNEGVKSRS